MNWSDGRRRRARRGPWGIWPARATAFVVLAALAQSAGTGRAWSAAALAASCEVPAAITLDRGLTPSPPTTGDTDATAAAGSTTIQIEGEDDDAAATAVPFPAATPAATPVQPASDPIVLLVDELTTVSEALAACLSEGDAEMVTQLAGERYLGQLFGGSVPLSKQEYVAIASELSPIPTRIERLEEVAQSADNRAMALVTQVVGNQLIRAEWIFEQAPRDQRRSGQTVWRLAGERQLPSRVPPNAAAIDVGIRDRSFRLDETDVEGPDVVLRGSNVSTEDHEMLVLRLADGYTTADLLRASGPDLPEAVTFVGELPVPAGAERDLVLVDLEQGEYTLVCLFPDPQGTPHLAQGMETVFTVE